MHSDHNTKEGGRMDTILYGKIWSKNCCLKCDLKALRSGKSLLGNHRRQHCHRNKLFTLHLYIAAFLLPVIHREITYDYNCHQAGESLKLERENSTTFCENSSWHCHLQRISGVTTSCFTCCETSF